MKFRWMESLIHIRQRKRNQLLITKKHFVSKTRQIGWIDHIKKAKPGSDVNFFIPGTSFTSFS